VVATGQERGLQQIRTNGVAVAVNQSSEWQISGCNEFTAGDQMPYSDREKVQGEERKGAGSVRV
jgi:hypothetical protein